jgi:hypothetical protein
MKINTVKTTPDETKSLGQIKAGEVFRFAYLSLTDALTENAFYMVIDAPEAKGGVLVVNIYDGKQLKRDKDHRVIGHNVSMNLSV